jgi:hypothetical protein
MAITYVLTTGKRGAIDSSTQIEPGVVLAGDIDDAALGNGLQGGYKAEDQTSAAISVKAKSGGAVTVTSDGVDVQAATTSVRGTMSASDYTKLQNIADLVFRKTGQSVSGADLVIPIATLAQNTMAMIEVQLCSSSVTHAGNYLVRKQLFGISRTTGAIAQIGTKVSLASLHTAGVNSIDSADMTVEAGATAGDWQMRITGVGGTTVDHVLTGIVVYLPSPA